jgi:hypothetical protein
MCVRNVRAVYSQSVAQTMENETWHARWGDKRYTYCQQHGAPVWRLWHHPAALPLPLEWPHVSCWITRPFSRSIFQGHGDRAVRM